VELHEALEILSDEGIVTDWADTYGEPGYHSEGPIMLGDWWCRCNDNPDDPPSADWLDTGKRPLHDVMHRFPEVAAVLEAAGAEAVWYDEWMVDYETSKAYRTQPDSYSWQPSVIYTEDGEPMTPDTDIEEWIEWAADNHRHALPDTIVSDGDLVGAGFVEYNRDRYESGWYGTEDDPEKIAEEVRKWHGPCTVVFKLSGVEQFRVTFDVWYRPEEEDD
jgi:hypothetical protein